MKAKELFWSLKTYVVFIQREIKQFPGQLQKLNFLHALCNGPDFQRELFFMKTFTQLESQLADYLLTVL